MKNFLHDICDRYTTNMYKYIYANGDAYATKIYKDAGI